MLEAIKNLGGLAMEENPDDFLSSLTLDIPKERGGKKQHLVMIYFDTKKESVSVDLKEIDDRTASDYLWIGNADGAMSPQWYFTTTNVDYLLSQTIPNYIDLLEDGNSKERFADILSKFYMDLGEQKGSQKRYRYVFNVEKFGLVGDGWIEATYQSLDNDAKKMVQEVKKVFLEWVKKQIHLTDKEISLYTLIVDGNPLVSVPVYKNLVAKKKVDEIFEEADEGICSICGEERPVTDDTTKFTLKYYMTDKIGFSSGISGDFIRNFPICKDCYTKMLVGEAYMKNNMGSRIGGLNLYIVPDILFKPDTGLFNMDRWAGYIKNSFNSVVSKEGLEKFENELKEYMDFENSKNNYILNLLFYEKNQAEFKILKLIKDVPPSRLDIIKNSFREAKAGMDGILGESPAWNIDLGKIYYLIPLKSTQKSIEYKKLLDFYDEIFSGKRVSYNFMIDQAVELCQVYYFNEFGQYNVKIGSNTEWDMALSYVMLQENILMKALKILGILDKGGKEMDYASLSVEKDYTEYLKEMRYDESKAALFLFGSLIADIATAQWKDGKDNKPILNKLNYQGMSWSKIQRLTGEVVEKLRQYKVLNKYNELKLSECMRLFDLSRAMNNGRWPLNDRENIYYILSGYGFTTARMVKYGRKDENSKKEEDENE
ncbi:MAG: TIGR02556 family CRISPR-associated protein [Thermoanaerobacteraceae bacterium]|nr:TIGR02556 family CRISPR-associated protein [Thermoanaerobacteraceae bacterium]